MKSLIYCFGLVLDIHSILVPLLHLFLPSVKRFELEARFIRSSSAAFRFKLNLLLGINSLDGISFKVFIRFVFGTVISDQIQ
ncbi:hypothetical protein QR98_0094060 [Sarcoptes scabiei]|uniref:Uncharacterized protein n=1 Tax=Sarcoptes scabiei TaxID=52283 RepID=A0A132AIU4_SARSC|nr:hypothetical protein QR98_0094060 [Sarcoptes scabiei]